MKTCCHKYVTKTPLIRHHDNVQGLGWKIHVLDPDHGSSAVLSRYFLLLSLGRTRIHGLLYYNVFKDNLRANPKPLTGGIKSTLA
jgi:hypothetical protein